MSIKSEIERIGGAVSAQTELITKISAALEGKAAGGGGGIPGTCTITINSFNQINVFGYTASDDGSITTHFLTYADGDIADGQKSMIVNNVLCGAMLFFSNGYPFNGYELSDDMELIAEIGNGGALLTAPSVSGTNATIEVIDND